MKAEETYRQFAEAEAYGQLADSEQQKRFGEVIRMINELKKQKAELEQQASQLAGEPGVMEKVKGDAVRERDQDRYKELMDEGVRRFNLPVDQLRDEFRDWGQYFC
jgi:hypothetical protein